jgi:protein SCO1/2
MNYRVCIGRSRLALISRVVAASISIPVFVLLLPASEASAQDIHAHHMSAAKKTETQAAPVAGLAIPDISLVDQHGRRQRFYSDLIRGRVVAINTIFSTCTTICPLMGANFAKLQKLLASDGNDKAQLISISIDPSIDTPERLDEWSRRFGQPGPGWTLLTGPKADIDVLLKALQIFTADKQEHAPVVLIGGERTESWVRAPALSSPSRLAELIHSRLQAVARDADIR